jgi:FixJ family two-component response regulator
MSVRGCISSPASKGERSCFDSPSATTSVPFFGKCLRLTGVSPVTIPFIGVVDDDEALCLSLVDLMRSVGYRAEAFTSAETLLGCDDLLSFDCIIADVHMPAIGGLSLVGELRQQGVVTPVILITALPQAHLDAHARSMGAFCLLRKPFETSSLLACVERSLLK